MAREREQRAQQSQGIVGRITSVLDAPSRFMQPRLILLVSAGVLLTFGLLMIFSASSVTAQADYGDPTYFVKRQLLFIAIGVAIAAIIVRFDYHTWSGRVLPVLWVAVFMLLALTLVRGTDSHGATRWIQIAGFQLQPSEFAKIICVLTTAYVLQRFLDDGEIDFRTAVLLLGFGVALPLLMILMQPDKGSTLIVAGAVVLMLYLSGLPGKYIAAVAVAGVAAILLLSLRDEYSRARIITMIDPWQDYYGTGYQLIQGFYAFGNGGLAGVGIGLSRQKYAYLPEAHNDFIFAIIGEETGFLGTIGVVIGFCLFVWAGYQIARYAPDLAGRLIAAGCTSIIALQFLVNVGGVLGLIPLTGKPLPFLSYGGSSVMSSIMLVGLIICVSRYSTLPETEHDIRRRSMRVTDDEDYFEDDYDYDTYDADFHVVEGGRQSTYTSSLGTSSLGQPRRINLGPSAAERLRPDSSTRTDRR